MDTQTNGKTMLQDAVERQRVKHNQQPQPSHIAEVANLAASRFQLAPLVPKPEPTAEELAARERSRLEWEAKQEQGRLRAQQSDRDEKWRRVEEVMGPRHANKPLSEFETYGTPEAQKAQRENRDKVAEFINNVREHVQEGRNLIFSGTKGTGKDFLMACVLRAAVLDHGLKARWMYGSNLFMSFRAVMSKGSKETEQDLVSKLSSPQILALSDPLPTVGPLTGYQSDCLQHILDERYRFKRPTFLTLNIESRTDAETRLGALQVDRIFEDALILYSAWPSYRQHKQSQAPEVTA